MVSCKLSCNGITPPNNYEDCYNRGLENEDNYCCYLKVSLPSYGNVSVCYEFLKSINIEFVRKFLISQYSEYNQTLEEFSCPSY